MKAHIGVDEFSGLVHHAACTVANVSDVTVTYALLHGREDCVLGDSGYIGADVRPAIGNARDRRQHERWERCEASMRSKIEHPFRVLKLQFGPTKVRSRPGKECRERHDAVYPIQSVDGAQAFAACKGLTIPRGITEASQ